MGKDLLLLAHFIANSSSLKTQDQHWVPVCMPGFNEHGYLQVFCFFSRTLSVCKYVRMYPLFLSFAIFLFMPTCISR